MIHGTAMSPWNGKSLGTENFDDLNFDDMYAKRTFPWQFMLGLANATPEIPSSNIKHVKPTEKDTWWANNLAKKSVI